ncbi:hypothetical protein JYU34_000497 [Plutella xylostella]|uniref:Uncharacterized protein n=2 Tax=Plutella xylostella TaxID=51655 RepID=A0ABQ7R7V3_PLUXY|nr:hypothetical protein JYU34_000497 [Plutella xylostella]CAG9137391.1 unnamed protein product [Plutella xylostella]
MKSLILLLAAVAASEAVNGSVYKVLLSQKGYTQFLQYDIEIPDLREFTLCAWFKLYNLDQDQTIFTYNLNGNRIIWLRMTSPDRIMKLSIAGKTVSSVAVTLPGNSWSHVCLSYQSASGAWAIYVDGNIVECQASDVLNGIVIPGGGNLIIGYGTDENGKPN